MGEGMSGVEVPRRVKSEREKLSERAALWAGTTLSAEWSWVYACTGSGERLHHLAKADDPERFEWECQGGGVATCGLRTRFSIPGILSRMGMWRCAHCCTRLRIPPGVGSPKNDAALRSWVESRLSEMRRAFTEEPDDE